MSTTLLIGALSGGGEPRLQPRRRRRDRDVLEHARGEARAQLGALDGSPRRPTQAPSVPGSSLHGAGASGAPVAACSSRATPYTPRQSGRLGVISSSSTSVAIGSTSRERRAGRELGVEQLARRARGCPAASAAELQLAARTGSSLRRAPRAASPASSLRAVGHHRAGPRDGDGLSGGDVRRAADDRRRAALASLAEVDLADLQAVGVRVLLGAQHAPDDEVAPSTARRGGGSPRPSCRSSSGAPRSRARRGRRIAVFAQPRQRHPHQNCSRKRRSFS